MVKKEALTNEQFFGYHCKAVRQLGASKYQALADLARKSQTPARLMSFLIKEEMSRC